MCKGQRSRQHGVLHSLSIITINGHCVSNFIKAPSLDFWISQHERTRTSPSVSGINQGDMGMDNFGQKHTTN